MKLFLFLIALFLMPFMALAEEAASTISNEQWLMDLLASIGGLKGATTMAIVLIVVKLLMKFMETPWGMSLLKGVVGKWKLVIVSVLTISSGILGLMSGEEGLSFMAALLHSTTLTAISVYINQIWKQFMEKTD